MYGLSAKIKINIQKNMCFGGALVNLILNAIFIPAIGINGAAIATLIAQIIVAIVAPGFYRDTRTSVKTYDGCNIS